MYVNGQKFLIFPLENKFSEVVKINTKKIIKKALIGTINFTRKSLGWVLKRIGNFSIKREFVKVAKYLPCSGSINFRKNG